MRPWLTHWREGVWDQTVCVCWLAHGGLGWIIIAIETISGRVPESRGASTQLLKTLLMQAHTHFSLCPNEQTHTPDILFRQIWGSATRWCFAKTWYKFSWFISYFYLDFTIIWGFWRHVRDPLLYPRFVLSFILIQSSSCLTRFCVWWTFKLRQLIWRNISPFPSPFPPNSSLFLPDFWRGLWLLWWTQPGWGSLWRLHCCLGLGGYSPCSPAPQDTAP